MVTSHAQKHFIRLYQQDKPLPLKVQETGEGYTLSGKPLDPNSAAAGRGLQGAAGKKLYRVGVADSSATKNTDKLDNSKITRDAVTNSQSTKKVYYVYENPLKGLIKVQGLIPGIDALSMLYDKVEHKATLKEDGTIVYKEQQFVSIIMGIYVIHLSNPSRKAVNGWQCVCYNNKS